MITKEQVHNALKYLKTHSPQRKFSQSIDLIINLKGLELKKPEEQMDIWVQLAHERGKPVRTCALVGPELKAQATAACSTTILHDDFRLYEGKKKEIKKLAKTHDFFIAQANIMPDVAKYFGRTLGPRGKMPNPKAGCVVPPNANLKALTEKLKKTIRLVAKTQLSAKCAIGKQEMPAEQLAENIITAVTAAKQALPQEDNNIKSVLLKHSMGPIAEIGNLPAKTEAKPEKAGQDTKAQGTDKAKKPVAKGGEAQ
jgi:large subunit ribosomal protein L1